MTTKSTLETIHARFNKILFRNECKNVVIVVSAPDKGGTFEVLIKEDNGKID